MQPLVQGVMLTHGTIASEVASLAHWLGAVGLLHPRKPVDHVYLSFLPLAHIYGRWVASARGWVQPVG